MSSVDEDRHSFNDDFTRFLDSGSGISDQIEKNGVPVPGDAKPIEGRGTLDGLDHKAIGHDETCDFPRQVSEALLPAPEEVQVTRLPVLRVDARERATTGQ